MPSNSLQAIAMFSGTAPFSVGVASVRSVFCAAAFVSLALTCWPARADNRPWTVLAILSGDFANIRTQLESVRDSEEDAPSSATLVLHDPPGRGDTVLYEVHYCPKEMRQVSGCLAGGSRAVALSPIGSEPSDVSLSDVDTLASLVRFVAETYPSDHLMIVLKGLSGFGLVLRDGDETPETGVDLPALRRILRAARDIRRDRVDLLVLASSASATVEAAYAVRGEVANLVATEQSTGDGRSVYFRLSTWRRMLRDNPTLAPRQLARLIARNYRDPSYPSFDAEQPYAVAALDLTAMEDFFEKLAALCTTLLAADQRGIPLLERTAAGVWHYGRDQTRVDLGGLLAALSATDDDSAVSMAALHARIGLSNSVISSFAEPQDGPTALSVFLPLDPATQWRMRQEYRRRFFSFPQESGWLALLRARAQYHRSLATGCSANPQGSYGRTPFIVSLPYLLLVFALRIAQRRKTARQSRHQTAREA